MRRRRDIGENMDRSNKGILTVTNLICIGASTGGPGAIEKIVTALPECFPVPIVIVQHLPKTFTRLLAGRLNGKSKLIVKEAAQHERLQAGVVYIAPGGKHLTVVKEDDDFTVQLTDCRGSEAICPSFDKLLFSLAEISGIQPFIFILTGMGSDGKKGLIAVKKKLACYAAAESRQSAVVYGMPGQAVATGLVDEELTLSEIKKKIIYLKLKP